MKSALLALVLVTFFLLVEGAAHAADLADTETFVQKAAAGNRFEIDSSKIAVKKSNNSAVKDFAQKMIDDHTKAGKNLKAALGKMGKDAPSLDDTPDGDQKSAIETLNQSADEDFNKAYIDAQVKAHDDTVALFQDYANNGGAESLKDFAQKTLPVLQQHQQIAKKLQDAH